MAFAGEGLGILGPQRLQVGLLHLDQEAGDRHARSVFLEVMLRGTMVLIAPPRSISPGYDGVVLGPVVDAHRPGMMRSVT